LRQGDLLRRCRTDCNEKAGLIAGLFLCGILRPSGSFRIHKTKSAEPSLIRNIVQFLSLSARAMQTREETFDE
jgi:hypothetical protein